MAERTPAQKMADYRKTFPKKVNARRLELIKKQHAGVPPEERGLRYDEHPGLREKHDALHQASLTPEEHAELAECERILDEWEERAPWWAERREMLDELGAEIERLKAKARAAERS
jgi:non-ribosomal peptide synthetase component F